MGLTRKEMYEVIQEVKQESKGNEIPIEIEHFTERLWSLLIILDRLNLLKSVEESKE